MTSTNLLRAAFALTLVAAGFGSAGTLEAQKVGRDWHEDGLLGFKFRPLDKYEVIPLQPGELGGTLVTRMSGPVVSTKNEVGDWGSLGLTTRIYAFPDRALEWPDDGADLGRTERQTIGHELIGVYKGFDEGVVANPQVDEPFSAGRLEGTHRRWTVGFARIRMIVDTWTFHMEDVDLALVFTTVPEKEKRYLPAFEKSAKTLRRIEREASEAMAGDDPVGEDVSYAGQLARAERECARTKGWSALPTESQKFIIKTSSDDRRFLGEVIERLELSRARYEEDFPPPSDFDAVSIVRICSTREEFELYGRMDRGAVGYFQPSSGELVLYDAIDVDRNMSFAVMSHEAFHQYCHHLFGRSEAHRWFDEGHGDYYGGAKIKRGQLEITSRMPAGLDRLAEIRRMRRDGTYAPLARHLNADHGAWQDQGPTNVSSYAQSWSIVFMLREGARGRVHRSVWSDEYASILPNYVRALSQGFQQAYDVKRVEAELFAEREGRSASKDELRFDSSDLGDEVVQRIWGGAMAASWGQVDLDAFERDWLEYVDKHLR